MKWSLLDKSYTSYCYINFANKRHAHVKKMTKATIEKFQKKIVNLQRKLIGSYAPTKEPWQQKTLFEMNKFQLLAVCYVIWVLNFQPWVLHNLFATTTLQSSLFIISKFIISVAWFT